jgi:4-hydroxybenzoate polyprenyltransferase
MLFGGALFGMAAHFVNVLKDMDQDKASGIKGLPQQLGKTKSIAAAVVLISLGITALVVS